MFARAYKTINNQRGDILVIAMALAVMSLISCLVILNYTRQVETGSKRPRIKSMMTSLEAKVRAALLSPTSYMGCQTGESTNTAAGRGTCSLNVSKITALTQILPDAPCKAGQQFCGIRVSSTSISPTGLDLITLPPPSTETVSRATIKIHYEGEDFSLADIDVVMDIPADILQSTGIYSCPEPKPIFKGFDTQGRMICDPLPARFGPNQFVNSIDPNTMTTTPFSLPPPVNCGNSNVISNLQWGNGGTNLSTGCSPRVNPFTLFGFTPKPTTSGGDVVYTVNPLQ